MYINIGELNIALKDMESGKVPEIDRLPIKFYKFFWSEKGEDLLQVLNKSLNTGLLPMSSRREIITLLPNKGDVLEISAPSHYSVIHLISLSKVLASKLSKVIDEITRSNLLYSIFQALFLMDLLNLNGLSIFYQNLLKVWSLLDLKRGQTISSLL